MGGNHLNWYNKLGFGLGNLGVQAVFTLFTSFVLIYLTDTVGLNPGIVGTLIGVAKLLDGISDVIFGNMIDRTHSKMGKARPWLFFSSFGLAIFLMLEFSIPKAWSETAKYAYLFVIYAATNAIFYTANSISYSTLIALVTNDETERVQLGVMRAAIGFVAIITTSLLVTEMVESFGGGVTGWRTTSVLFAVISFLFCSVAVFSVRELPENEQGIRPPDEQQYRDTTVGLLESVRILLHNKYFPMLVGIQVILYILTNVSASAGIYYTTYVLGNPGLLGILVFASLAPMIIGIVLTPAFIKKTGSMYKANTIGYVFSFLFLGLFAIGGYLKSIPLMIISQILSSFGAGPLNGDIDVLISSAAEYSYLKTGKRIEGSMFSCTSLGIKLGGGLGTAMLGWFLAAGGYDGMASAQPASAIAAINAMYLLVPLIGRFLILIISLFLKVESDVSRLKDAK